MFNAGRLALMMGTSGPPPSGSPHLRENAENRGSGVFAFLIDVAGMDETALSAEGWAETGWATRGVNRRR